DAGYKKAAVPEVPGIGSCAGSRSTESGRTKSSPRRCQKGTRTGPRESTSIDGSKCRVREYSQARPEFAAPGPPHRGSPPGGRGRVRWLGRARPPSGPESIPSGRGRGNRGSLSWVAVKTD